jgi:hypothetical protein
MQRQRSGPVLFCNSSVSLQLLDPLEKMKYLPMYCL